jgi:penicillin-binding protein 2
MFLKRNKKYSISFDSEDWVTPEETLLDSSSHYSNIEKPISSSVFRFFVIIFSISAVVLAVFIFKLSILDNKKFAHLAFMNKSANFPLPPPRGLIVDRSGQPLVINLPVFNLLAVTRELKENYENLDESIINVSEIINKDPKDYNEFIKDEMADNSTFFAYLDLDKNQAVAIKYLELKGFYVVPDTKRKYIDGRKTSQILGYTGKVSREDLDNDDYYFSTDTIGRLGIEGYYEEFIRGKHGNIFFSREEVGHITKEPEPGQTIFLNIDHDLQIKLHDEIFATLRDSGLSKGAGIIQNPKTGEVLALASFPDYDNNIFTSEVSQSDYKRLFEGISKPLFNRIISGLYNPGSTIKPLVGMSGMQEDIMDSDDVLVNDCIELTVPNPYDTSKPYIFNNWRKEYGPFNLIRAIANSCNIYFFTVGGGHEKIKGLGAEKLINYLKRSFADSELGIDIPGESSGFVPTPEWKLREKGEPWYLGDTYNISIGQGDLLVSPLWLNSYISGIANNGNIYKPRIVKDIISKDGETLNYFEPEIIGTLPFSEYNINEMKKATRETVLTGTAQSFKNLPVKMAAKTGTAEIQKGKTVNSLFTIFGPYDNPDFTMTILIEGATTQQGLAIKAAYNVLNWYYNK